MCLGLPHVTGRIGYCEIFHIKVVSLTLHGGNITEVLVWTVLATVSVVGHHHSVNALAQQADKLSFREVDPLGINTVFHENHVASAVGRAGIHRLLHRHILSRTVGCHD